MSQEILNQYVQSMKAGQKYVKAAQGRGENPYPLVLDTLLENVKIVRQEKLGLLDIPTELIVGTKTVGRVNALAGNFMPLLAENTEFASKWMLLCEAHLEEGIRDPVQCYEYLGKFYIEEGNKRVSVLRSFDAPSVPGSVVRLVPEKTEEPAVLMYYEFLDFYALSGLYGLEFKKPGSYRRLQAALGLEADAVWTTEERRSFSAGYAHFRAALETRRLVGATPAEALLSFLEIHSFRELKEMTSAQLTKALEALWPDVSAQAGSEPIKLTTEPDAKEKSLVSRILSAAVPDHIHAAFIYGFSPEESEWTRAHEHGRLCLEEKLGSAVETSVWFSGDEDPFSAMEKAVDSGAKLIFATLPSMIEDCRRIAAAHKGVKVLNCAISQPYTGVRMYYARSYECKFITGAIAGAMATEDEIGYIADYPIFGTPAGINAFALGARLTNPRARIRLRWSCLDDDPLGKLLQDGVRVISNRDAAYPSMAHGDKDWGLFRIREDGQLQTLAVPCLDWGEFYVRLVRSIFNGGWNDEPSDRSINYYWGLDSGVLDLQFPPELPDGVCRLARLLRGALAEGSLQPFSDQILDQDGVLRCGEGQSLRAEEIVAMDWLCENVDGAIPPFEALQPRSRELVRLLGVYRDLIAPQKVERQL